MESSSVIEIRNLKSWEFLDFMRILHKIFPDRSNSSLFLNLYEVFPEGFIVAVDKKRFVGFAIGVIDHGGNGRILLIGVDKDFRRKGIGSMLLKRLLLLFSMKGARKAELEVRVSNLDAIRFYERMGFRLRERVDGYYEDGESAYIMEKNL